MGDAHTEHESTWVPEPQHCHLLERVRWPVGPGPGLGEVSGTLIKGVLDRPEDRGSGAWDLFVVGPGSPYSQGPERNVEIHARLWGLCCPTTPFLAEARMETQHWLSRPLTYSPSQAPRGTTKIWDLVSWQRDECMHNSSICFKLSIKISTVLEK